MDSIRPDAVAERLKQKSKAGGPDRVKKRRELMRTKALEVDKLLRELFKKQVETEEFQRNREIQVGSSDIPYPDGLVAHCLYYLLQDLNEFSDAQYECYELHTIDINDDKWDDERFWYIVTLKM